MRLGLNLDASLSFLTTEYNARPCDLKKSSKSSKLLHGAQFLVFTSLPVHFKIKSTPPTRQDDCILPGLSFRTCGTQRRARLSFLR